MSDLMDDRRKVLDDGYKAIRALETLGLDTEALHKVIELGWEMESILQFRNLEDTLDRIERLRQDRAEALREAARG
jgi:hypothetical protein